MKRREMFGNSLQELSSKYTMNKYKFAEHKDEIITHIVKNLIWFPIAATIPLVYKLINFLLTNFVSETECITRYKILISISIFLSITSIIINLIYFKKMNKKDTLDELCDYHFSHIIAELTFDDNRKNITSTIDYKMTVLTERATKLKRNLIWSGSKYNYTKIVSKNGDYELIDSNRNHSPYPYTIKFNEEKKRGDYIQFKTETSVVDENLDMLPEYSFMVKYQIDKLTLRVIAPKNMIKNVKKVIYMDSAKEICIETPTLISAESIRNLVRYTYEISNPILLYNYFIEWEFTN